MSFLRKAALVNSAEFVSLGVAVLRTAVLTRVLGPVGIGQYAIILSVLLLAPQICSFGVPMSFLYHSQHNSENTRKYLMHAFWAMLFLGVIGGLAMASLVFLKTSYFGSITLFAGIGIGCYVLIVLAHNLARCALLIRIEAYKLGLMRIVPMICGTLLVMILSVLGMLTTSRAIVCLVLTEFMAMLLGWVWIRSHIDFSVRFDWKLFRKLGFMGIRLNWIDLVLLVNAQLSILIIKYLLGNFESVGYFSRGQRIAMLVVVAGQAITPLLFSRWASFPEEKLTMHVEKVMRFASTISVIAIVATLLFGKWIILLLYGRDFLPALVPLMILVPGAVLNLLSRIFIPLLGSRGHPEIVAIALIIGAAINVALCWLFIPAMGIIGAAWAFTAGNTVLLGLLTLFVRKKYNIRVVSCFGLNKGDIESVVESLPKKVLWFGKHEQ